MWPYEARHDVIALTKDIQQEFKPRSTIIFGYSAGGFLSSWILHDAPDVFGGAVINANTPSAQLKPTAETLKRFIYVAIGDQDNVYTRSGGKQGLEILGEVARLLATQPDIRFVFCGEGPTKPVLQAACRDLPNVHFLPLQLLQHSCDCLI